MMRRFGLAVFLMVALVSAAPSNAAGTEADHGETILEAPAVGTRGEVVTLNSPWVALPATPFALSRSAGAVVGDRFYVIGGEESGGARNGHVQVYDPTTNSWSSTAAPMPTPLSNICAAAIGTLIYVPGGWTGSAGVVDLQVYDTVADSWSAVATDPLPEPLSATACAAHNGRLYVFGGGAGAQNTNYIFDPSAAAGSRWTSGATVPVAGGYGDAVAAGGYLFYGGILGPGTTNLADVLRYDPVADSWTALPALTTARGGAGMWVYDGKLAVGGGGWSTYLTSVEEYDLSAGTGGTWTLGNPLVAGSRTFASAQDDVNDVLYKATGWAGAFQNAAESSTFGPPEIGVDPLAMAAAQPAGTVTQQTLTISNTGGTDLEWEIEQEPIAGGLGLRGGMSPRAAAVGDTGDRSGTRDNKSPQEYISVLSFSEGFEDIDDLPGWFMQNNSSPVGTTGWFQGNPGVFNAHAGPDDSYIGANFNNTSGAGTISNWLLTPEVNLANGDTISFWTRCTGAAWPDRLELRLSTSGGSTNVGSAATDVGDFSTLLLAVNPDLVPGGYPDTWTQYSVTLSGIPAGASGRFAFRYFVIDGGPSGSNSDYIGIDTVEFTGEILPDPCDNPANVPWLSVTPAIGTTAPAGSTPVTVGFDSAGLAVGLYEANLCVFSNDPGNSLVVVPVELQVTVPPTATVTVEVGPDGGGSVSGGGVFDVGDEVTVQAVPAFGWVFLYWEINGTQITDNPYTFVVTEDITLTAVFEQQEIEAIPTTGTIGLVLLLALLAGVGVFVLRRM